MTGQVKAVRALLPVERKGDIIGLFGKERDAVLGQIVAPVAVVHVLHPANITAPWIKQCAAFVINAGVCCAVITENSGVGIEIDFLVGMYGGILPCYFDITLAVGRRCGGIAGGIGGCEVQIQGELQRVGVALPAIGKDDGIGLGGI